MGKFKRKARQQAALFVWEEKTVTNRNITDL